MRPRVTPQSSLAVAGWLCICGALIHFACIPLGAGWLRLIGGGEQMARAVERGAMFPHVVAAAIGCLLLIWAAYAFAGARRLSRGMAASLLPFQRTVLVLTCAVLSLRVLAVLVPDMWRTDLSFAFKLATTVMVLPVAVCLGHGTWRAWPALSDRKVRL